MLLVIVIIKNNQPRQKEAWVYNQHGRLIKHYTLPADRQKLTELGRIIGDSGGELSTHLHRDQPRRQSSAPIVGGRMARRPQ